MTDGEIDDATELPADLLARTRIEVWPRTQVRDVAVASVEGPARVTAGDSLRYDVSIRFTGDSAPDSAVVELRSDDAKRPLLTRRSSVRPVAMPAVSLRAATSGMTAGEHLLSVKIVNNRDAEPRTDERFVYLAVAATPGVVLVANPADWDARFLFRTIREVAALPVRATCALVKAGAP